MGLEKGLRPNGPSGMKAADTPDGLREQATALEEQAKQIEPKPKNPSEPDIYNQSEFMARAEADRLRHDAEELRQRAASIERDLAKKARPKAPQQRPTENEPRVAGDPAFFDPRKGGPAHDPNQLRQDLRQGPRGRADWRDVKAAKPLIGAGAAIVVVIAGAIAFGNNRPATVSSDAARATTSLTPATNAPGAAGRPAAIDVCALVTAQESTTILEKPVTPQTTTPGLQCSYRPDQQAKWTFQERDRVATITIDGIIITIATGTDAQARYDAKQAIYGKDPTSDEVINGLGDKAIFTAGSEVSVLSGARFINVHATGDYDWGSGSTRYEDVHQKVIAVLVAFARTALPRMP